MATPGACAKGCSRACPEGRSTLKTGGACSSCAAAPGTSSPGYAVRPTAASTGPATPATASVAVWSASPRALPSTLNPSISQHWLLLNPDCLFAAVSAGCWLFHPWRRRRLDSSAHRAQGRRTTTLVAVAHLLRKDVQVNNDTTPTDDSAGRHHLSGVMARRKEAPLDKYSTVES